MSYCPEMYIFKYFNVRFRTFLFVFVRLVAGIWPFDFIIKD